MKLHSRTVAVFLTALAGVTGLGVGGAAATTPDPTVPDVVLTATEKQALQAKVDQRLGDYGGGEQIGLNQIAYHDGQTILTIPFPGEKKARAIDEPVTAQGLANCSYEYACLWSDTNFNGQRLASAACRTITLGAPFTSSTGSIHNNQTPGTETIIFNSARNILNANLSGSRINDTGVGTRWSVRYWLVCA